LRRACYNPPVRRVLLLLILLLPTAVRAIDDLDVEEDVADLLATPDRRHEPTDVVARRPWAVLPQVGYGPETGPVGGVKFEHRNLAGVGITFDVDATYALNLQQDLTLSVGWPHLLDDRFLLLFRAGYHRDPQLDFFGLGNNDLGPDPASTHAFERADGNLVFGWRPTRHLALNAGVGLRHVRVGRGDRDDDDTPFTLDRFPTLPGVQGGFVNPFEASLIWNTRDSVLRPTRGVRVILKVAHTNRSLLSDYEFTRGIADLGAVRSWRDGRHVVAARLNGALIDGPERAVPFWELEELGGDDTLRGFFPYRFRGRGRVLLNLEYRGHLTSFDFFDVWRVWLDGVLFGEGGRVFIDRDELSGEFDLDRGVVSRLVHNLQYSYGAGFRISLSEALVARIDVGFSEEETGARLPGLRPDVLSRGQEVLPARCARTTAAGSRCSPSTAWFSRRMVAAESEPPSRWRAARSAGWRARVASRTTGAAS
jgi:outer membrane protein assembly factor BamA